MSETAIISRRLLLAAAAGFALPAGAGAAPKGRAGAGRARAAPPLPVVMLDAGHGGKDPGAIGVSGTYEKHIALAAAQELRRQLLAAKVCRVMLTRGRDVFIPLPERVAIAQKHGASLFVSMHADAVNDSRVRGASVYTLSDTASDAQTAALARRENSVDRFGPRYRDMAPDVAQILSSLARQETRYGSAAMASEVVDAFDDRVGLLANPSRHAHFAVLKAADIPSVLVEMGFMSNRLDEAALRRADHRARVAAALRRAIETFLAANERAVQVVAG